MQRLDLLPVVDGGEAGGGDRGRREEPRRCVRPDCACLAGRPMESPAPRRRAGKARADADQGSRCDDRTAPARRHERAQRHPRRGCGDRPARWPQRGDQARLRRRGAGGAAHALLRRAAFLAHGHAGFCHREVGFLRPLRPRRSLAESTDGGCRRPLNNNEGSPAKTGRAALPHSQTAKRPKPSRPI